MKYVSKMNVGARFLNFCTYLCVLPVVCSCRCVKMERDRQAGVPGSRNEQTTVKLSLDHVSNFTHWISPSTR